MSKDNWSIWWDLSGDGSFIVVETNHQKYKDVDFLLKVPTAIFGDLVE